jgi:glucosamine--fructose-6-phosphate aminotransferase (isomerizing)
VIAICSPLELSLQKDLLSEVKNKCGSLIVVSGERRNIWRAHHHIRIPVFKNYAVAGIPFIFVAQAISLYTAYFRGINPDKPKGLAPWIVLKEKG